MRLLATRSFSANWRATGRGLPGALRGRSYFEVDGASRLLKGFSNFGLKKPTWYFLERDASIPWEVESKKLEAHRALYVHLDQVGFPPVQPDKLTPAFIDDVLQRMSQDQLALWDKLVGPSKNSPKRLALLVSVPRQAGGRSLVAASFTASRGAVDNKGIVTPLTMRRHTPTYMREREVRRLTCSTSTSLCSARGRGVGGRGHAGCCRRWQADGRRPR